MKFEFDTIEQIIAFADRVRLVDDQRKVSLESQCRQMLTTHGPIDVIKFYREKTGAALKDAKDYIDSLREEG